MSRTKQFDQTDVLNKAMELFWKKGFHATSVQDLVDHLGINRASLYDTFGDKKALYCKALNQYRSFNIEMLEQLFASQTTVKVGLQMLFDMAIQESVKDKERKGCFIVNSTTEMVPDDQGLHQFLSDNKSWFEARLSDFLQKGIDSGEIKTSIDSDGLAAYIYTLYVGLRVVAKINPDKKQMRATVNAGLSLFG